jgi:hypothetical protein
MMEFDDFFNAGIIPPLEIGTLAKIASAHPDVIADLRNLEPLKTAATFAGLLTIPDLQASCLRIEVLVHLALAYCGGRRAPTQSFVRRSFERLGKGTCGRMEDPAEDVFLTLVNTSRGNFRVFDGISEGAGFYLQRILNVVDCMPKESPYNELRDSVECLLRLSDAVAERAGLHENSRGQDMPLESLHTNITSRLSTLSDVLYFHDHDLAELKIPPGLLARFAIGPNYYAVLQEQSLGNTDLERYPVGLRGDGAYLLLPTAVSSAIRRAVIESAVSIKRANSFDLALVSEFGKLFHEMPTLGKGAGIQVNFQKIRGGHVGALMQEVDPGRYIHLIFFVDGLDGFFPDGLGGANADPSHLSSAISAHLKHASDEATSQSTFRDGISLVVACGYGRALYLAVEDTLPEHWRLESIAAHDFTTLSWLSGFEPLSLWRLLDARDAIKTERVELLNVNGLLNLIAWSRQLKGHLVPHGQLQDGFVDRDGIGIVVVDQNALRDLRYKVARERNPRRVLDSEGRWIRVSKLDKSSFEEDNYAPLYASEEDVLQDRLRGVFVASNRPWWIEIRAPENAPRESVYEHWVMLCVWLGRAAPVLDRAYQRFPEGPVTFIVTFNRIVGDTPGTRRLINAVAAQSLCEILADAGKSFIRINVGDAFDDAIAQEENVAERSLVEALVSGAALAAGEDVDVEKQRALVARICPNSQARWMHRFEARSFRDFVKSDILGKPILIDPLDDGASRIGFGWKIRPRDSSPNIVGIAACTSYLNDAVKVLLDDLCTQLRTFDRSSFVRAILQNHEAAARDRDVWRRTTQAIIGLHDDQEATIRTIVEHHGRLNACFLASRILLEAALCECPNEGGGTLGELDLCRAMARAMMAHYLGGWSDAIRWGAMEPRLRITPLGDVHLDHSFLDAVYEPFGRVGGEIQVKQAREGYAALHEPAKTPLSPADILDSKFLDAWRAEFGTSLEGILAFMGYLEDMNLQPPKALCSLPRSALVNILAKAAACTTEGASVTLGFLTLEPRLTWRTVSKDWYPWRFRRPQSVFRRPFLQLNNNDDPEIVFAPGIVTEGFQAMVHWFYHGEIPSQQAKSREMRIWIGHANNVQRLAFNSIVADKMRQLGWEVEPEIKLTKLLNRSLDRDYGDIDVLAWRPNVGRVLVMECKDLQYHKTIGEVAEQLSDFRGELRSDGKSDHLKKHLDRVEVVKSQQPAVAKTLKLSSPITIEGHLVFKNPVPMQFAWDHMANKIRLSLFTELDRL